MIAMILRILANRRMSDDAKVLAILRAFDTPMCRTLIDYHTLDVEFESQEVFAKGDTFTKVWKNWRIK